MQDLLIQHIKKVGETSHQFVCFKHFAFSGGRGLATIDRLLTVSLVLEHWTGISRKRASKPKMYYS